MTDIAAVWDAHVEAEFATPAMKIPSTTMVRASGLALVIAQVLCRRTLVDHLRIFQAQGPKVLSQLPQVA